MPKFSFQIASKLPNKKKYVHISKGTILEKDITGIVHIRINGSWYVNYENTQYPIHPDCWETKGVKVVYPKRLLHGRKWVYIRCEQDGLPHVNDALPFGAGCVVVGNIVHNEVIDVKFFKIKKVNPVDIYNNESIGAARFYRENWQEIFKKNDDK